MPAREAAVVCSSECHPARAEIWSLADKRKLVELPAHGEIAMGVDFHPDGTRLASSGNDNAIRLWDTTTWEPVLELRGHSSYVKTVVFSPDGTQLASGSGDLSVRIWDTVPRDERHQQVMTARGRQLSCGVRYESPCWELWGRRRATTTGMSDPDRRAQ